MKFHKRDKHYKKMVKEIVRQIKKSDICFYQEIDGGKIDEMKLEPCQKILVIAFN